MASEDRAHDLRIMRPTRYELRYCHLFDVKELGRVILLNIELLFEYEYTEHAGRHFRGCYFCVSSSEFLRTGE